MKLTRIARSHPTALGLISHLCIVFVDLCGLNCFLEIWKFSIKDPCLSWYREDSCNKKVQITWKNFYVKFWHFLRKSWQRNSNTAKFSSIWEKKNDFIYKSAKRMGLIRLSFQVSRLLVTKMGIYFFDLFSETI